MSAIEFIKTKLWDGEYFSPEKLGDEEIIFSHRYTYPLICNIVDGIRSKAWWPLVTGSNSATESLFLKIKPIVSRYGAKWIYIKDPDNALSIIEWEREVNPKYFNTYVLSEFEINPAEEGGMSYLVLLFEDKEGMIVFAYGDEDEFKISYYGNVKRLELIKEYLHNKQIQRMQKARR